MGAVVHREKAVPLDERPVVGLVVVGAAIAPVPAGMASQGDQDLVRGKRVAGVGGDQEATEGEQGRSVCG